jgi:hypothetical protein
MKKTRGRSSHHTRGMRASIPRGWLDATPGCARRFRCTRPPRGIGTVPGKQGEARGVETCSWRMTLGVRSGSGAGGGSRGSLMAQAAAARAGSGEPAGRLVRAPVGFAADSLRP